jgi:CheY-like chemotaxis protein/nitrogen-specific signal transduction histidine kinase
MAAPSDHDQDVAALLAEERDARARAEEENRRKDEFLSLLSHELRTPLNALLTWARVLRRVDLEPAIRDRALEAIERNARVQTKMVEDLIDTTKIASGRLALDETEDVDISALVREAVEAALPAARDKGVELLHTSEGIGGIVHGDAARLHQVIANLLSNSIRFTPQGGLIKVIVQSSQAGVEISVTDTGEGISPDLMPSLFDRFRRGLSRGKTYGGLGLGLTIARHLAHLHGGTIAAESPGKGLGTVMRVQLPLQSAAPRPLSEGGEMPAVPEEQNLDGINVVVVEDDVDSRNALEMILLSAGAKVRIASSAREALRLFVAERPDVVLTDLAMPEQDGYALARALRSERGEQPPIIALTAFAMPSDRKRVLESGFALHLTKPIDPEELLVAVAMAAAGEADKFAAERFKRPLRR